MKCPNCGYENPDIRLFCARCGEILPEKEEETPVKQAESAQTEEKKRDYDVMSEPFDDVDFYRRRQRARRVYEDAWPEQPVEDAPKTVRSIFDDEDAAPVREERPRPEYRTAPRPDTYIPRREENIDPDSFFDVDERPNSRDRFSGDSRRAPDLGGTAARPETFVPRREEELGPDNFFDVNGRSSSFDREDAPARKRRLHRGNEFEDADDGQSFAVRHMRGIVTIALLLFTVAIMVIWAITPGAQKTLAKLDLAWDASAYEELGLDAWADESYTIAAHYFTKAYDKDPRNTDYAKYAAESWIRAENNAMAAQALRKCIAAEPANVDFYLALIDICYGYDNLPDSDRLLVDEGYRRTGDSRLDYTSQEE